MASLPFSTRYRLARALESKYTVSLLIPLLSDQLGKLSSKARTCALDLLEGRKSAFWAGEEGFQGAGEGRRLVSPQQLLHLRARGAGALLGRGLFSEGPPHVVVQGGGLVFAHWGYTVCRIPRKRHRLVRRRGQGKATRRGLFGLLEDLVGFPQGFVQAVGQENLRHHKVGVFLGYRVAADGGGSPLGEGRGDGDGPTPPEVVGAALEGPRRPTCLRLRLPASNAIPRTQELKEVKPQLRPPVLLHGSRVAAHPCPGGVDHRTEVVIPARVPPDAPVAVPGLGLPDADAAHLRG